MAENKEKDKAFNVSYNQCVITFMKCTSTQQSTYQNEYSRKTIAFSEKKILKHKRLKHIIEANLSMIIF